MVKPFARLLGPKGYMPSLKGGSLVKEDSELQSALKMMKAGQVEFKYVFLYLFSFRVD